MTIAVPHIPETAPFTLEQRAWLNGFLAGLFSRQTANGDASPASPPRTARLLTILYGSETGNSEMVAKMAAKKAREKSFEAKAQSLDSITAASLRDAGSVLIVTSTYGDGDPPANAHDFWRELCAAQPGSMMNLHYGVLALGDRSYPKFCAFGRAVDERLADLGAHRLLARVDCDVEFEAPAKQWVESALAHLSDAPEQPARLVQRAAPAPVTASEKPPAYSRKHPFPARLLRRAPLNTQGSVKETHHLEFDLEGSGLHYEPGDALGVVPVNCPDAADELIRVLKLHPEDAVAGTDGTEVPLRDALLTHYDIRQVPTPLLEAVAERTDVPDFRQMVALNGTGPLGEYLRGREVVDVLLENPKVRFTAREFVDLLRKLAPRLYSIASSQKARAQEVHLTVGAVRYKAHGRPRKGTCSTFLGDRVREREPVGVFLHRNNAFRLPASPDTPIIMVGPGTGIAPFRSFLQERLATGARGGAWLFFGNPNSSTDFLYRQELKAFLAAGTLNHLDLAFSRDQEEKVYVQHRLQEKGAQVYRWLMNGAHFYVCGDATRMAADVDIALHHIFQQHGTMSAEEAAVAVETLRHEKRYQRDVY